MRYRIFTPANLIIFIGALCIVPLLLLIKVIHYNYVATSIGLSFPILATSILVIAAFFAITFIYYRIRYQYAKRLEEDASFNTFQGTLVLSRQLLLDWGYDSAQGSVSYLTSEAIEVAINFWSEKLGHKQEMLEYFSTGTLTFKEDTTEWQGNGGMSKTKRRIIGLTFGNDMGVEWQKGQPFPRRLLIHEAGHVCLSAAGIDPTTHEQVMVEYKFGY